MTDNYDVPKWRADDLMQALRAVLGSDWEPALYEPGFHHDKAWVIACESGPHDWVLTASEFANGNRQHGVFVEPVNHWSVAIFPGDCGCGQLKLADWNLQLWLQRPGQGADPEKLCLHLQLCDLHKGTPQEYVPQGWTLTGQSYTRQTPRR